MSARTHLWIAIAGVLLAGAAIVGPTGAAAQQMNVPAICLFPLDATAENRVRHGGQFAIVLPSNRTTGFSWALGEDFEQQSTVEIVSHLYVPQPGGLIGAGGAECWIFQADHHGSATITLNYARPWEKDTPPARTAQFHVTVLD